MKRRFVFALLAAGLMTVAAQERFDFKIRNYFFAGFAGNAASLSEGMKICEETLASDPKNAEALVWHGAGLYYQSGQYFQKGNQEQGIALWTKGIAEMDRAVELAPENVGVRIPRGAALMTGSRFQPDQQMARPLVEKAVSDYEKSLEMQAANFDQLGVHARGELLIGLGEGYARLGNQDKANLYYGRLISELPGTPYAKKAAKYMETKTTQTGCLGCHAAK